MDTGLLASVGMILAAVLGPVTAVLITLFWERARRTHDQKQTVLQTLLATRGRYADPGYSWAIRTVPIYFSQNADVMKAHSDYLDSVRLEPSPENRERQDQESGRRQGVLISEILKDLGFKGLTSEQIEAYTAQGLADREILLENALRALPHIAISAKRSADYSEAIATKVAGPEAISDQEPE